VKTTVDLPDELLRRAKATAAVRGESLRVLLTEALTSHLEAPSGARPGQEEAWRKVFGKAQPEEVAEIDAAVTAHLEQVDFESWR
jgi:hypothetical protein